jgi:hypothetical protein
MAWSRMAGNAVTQPGGIGAIRKIGCPLQKRGTGLWLRIVAHDRYAKSNCYHS